MREKLESKRTYKHECKVCVYRVCVYKKKQNKIYLEYENSKNTNKVHRTYPHRRMAIRFERSGSDIFCLRL